MPAEILKLSDRNGRAAALDRAARLLTDGGIVVFPTETVYGVAASAARDDAVNRLRAVKGRAGEQPFTVHVGSREQAEQFVVEPSVIGKRLMAKSWPGPVTLLFAVPDPVRAAIHARLSAEGRRAIYREGRVGLRFPDDTIAMDLLRDCSAPIIASSANHAGQPPPTDAESAAAQLGDDVDLILDGGRSRYGRASTIVSVNGKNYQVVREGVFDERTINRLAALNILFVCTGNTCRSPMAEAITRQIFADRLHCAPADLPEHGVQIASCGISAAGGMPAADHAVAVLSQRGIELGRHRAQPATPSLLHSADFIFTMTESHRRAVLELLPSAESRVSRLDKQGDIEDPVGGDLADYARSADHITDCITQRLGDLSP